MKTAYRLLIFLMVVSAGFSQNKQDKFQVKVKGLGCPFCAYGLEKKLKEIKSIKKISIDMKTGMTQFKVSSKNQITLDEVAKKVEKAGYTPVALKVLRASGLEEVKDALKPKNDLKNISKLKISVKGNCEMCKARIEKSVLSVNGVGNAYWDVETKVLDVTLDTNLTSKVVISKAIASVGHDTEYVKATEQAYENLPVCCLYKNR